MKPYKINLLKKAKINIFIKKLEKRKKKYFQE